MEDVAFLFALLSVIGVPFVMFPHPSPVQDPVHIRYKVKAVRKSGLAIACLGGY